MKSIIVVKTAKRRIRRSPENPLSPIMYETITARALPKGTSGFQTGKTELSKITMIQSFAVQLRNIPQITTVSPMKLKPLSCSGEWSGATLCFIGL